MVQEQRNDSGALGRSPPQGLRIIPLFGRSQEELNQEEPGRSQGGARKGQESRRIQEEPVGARSQEPGGARGSQEEPPPSRGQRLW